jgi:uncharacterized FlaG/YvyC family protein
MTYDVVSVALAVGPGIGKPQGAAGVRPEGEPEGGIPFAQGVRLRPEEREQTIAERAREDTAAAEDAAEKSTTERVEEVRGPAQTRLSILYDEDAELFVSRIIDKVSGEIVSQYPYETQIARIRFFVEQLSEAREDRLDVTV